MEIAVFCKESELVCVIHGGWEFAQVDAQRIWGVRGFTWVWKESGLLCGSDYISLVVSLHDVAWYTEGGSGLLFLNKGSSLESGVKFVGGPREKNMRALDVE